MRHINTICFDLDDTLWDMQPVIRRAENALYGWFDEHCPRVTARYTPAQLLELRLTAARQFPELRHDLTALRYKVLHAVLTEADYSTTLADDAFAVFQRERNAVQLYAEVPEVLQRLAQSHRLLALTNGNADLHTIGLAHCFEAVYTARAVGAAKPDRGFFTAVLSQAGLDPAATLHVGDHPENDIVAARAVGMKTLWLNRRGDAWQREDCRPDIELANLNPLPELLQP